ncbi:putative cysteine-rich receptor-like protein kinase 23 isoform X3 [Eutrema salsugineum]|uniref:putative cysteine-rich receptor-like protein kinase 23 isoform X3 n=1 Tax=Eutrema salsugineum TaxID=72664 RepID=UPI000CED4033|nr:putative cysteine-rich receptor-like protein kinase 23 isoform X3 [Eutrema salsugineum]
MSGYTSKYVYHSLFLFSFLTSFKASAQDPSYVHHICPNTTTFSRNSTFSTNLRTLLYSLSSHNACYSTGFQNATAGQAPDRVTGLFLCRGDVSPEVCRSCVTFAVNDTLTWCPNQREVTLYYDQCSLRFSNRNILSTLSTDGELVLWNPQNVTSNQEDQFRDLVLSTMNQAATEAARSSRKFSTVKANWTALRSFYGLVQCTPDLTRQDCLSCLRHIINRLHTDKIGGRSLVQSCSTRYELYAFYNESAVGTRRPQLNPAPPPRQLNSAPPPPPISIPSPRPGLDIRFFFDYTCFEICSIQYNSTDQTISVNTGKSRNSTVIIISVVVPVTTIFLFFFRLNAAVFEVVYTDKDDITTAGSLQFEFKAIEAATDKFSICNKLGQGGFGAVYKGTFPNGVQVAVKRLSKTSGQGEREFENELVVVAKLQHRNLVRLLGFCLEGEEKILVYEFVPNKSLDYFLFDSRMQNQLDWTRRYKIIGGIARGILYLHQDSRLTIIHRDLKAGNILLDADMNPKVADFGMARIFGVDQTEAKTRRVVGTYIVAVVTCLLSMQCTASSP